MLSGLRYTDILFAKDVYSMKKNQTYKHKPRYGKTLPNAVSVPAVQKPIIISPR